VLIKKNQELTKTNAFLSGFCAESEISVTEN
jgi:hypothetical protein